MSAGWPDLLSAAAGAALGSGLTYHFGRPRLGVTVDRVTLSPSRVATSLPVPANAELMRAVEDSPSNYLALGLETPPERTYVTYLLLLAQRVEDTSAELANIENIAARLRSQSAEEDFSAVLDTYKRAQEALWAWAEGEIRRGRRLFTSHLDDARLEEGLASSDVYETANSVVLQIPGTIHLGFGWNPGHSLPVQETVRHSARRVALAFAQRNKQDLLDFFASIRDVVSVERTAATTLSDLVRQELSVYSRLQVEVLVTNSGRAGVSIDSRAAALLHLKNYTYAAADDSGHDTKASTVDDDSRISLTVIPAATVDDLMAQARHASSADLRVDQASPILIEAGSTVRLLATSDQLVSQMPVGIAMTKAFSAAERSMRIHLGQFRQQRLYTLARRNGSTKRISSRRVPFRSFRQDR